MAVPRLCAVSVDLDEVPCYTAIHGLSELPESSRHAIYRRAMPRLLELFDELDLKATLFAIGRDLSDASAAALVRRAAADGHEIGNHSYDHHYDLSRRSAVTVRDQIERGAQAIASVTGERPVGFRAPGYTINDRMFEALAEQGALYDSSVFPCPFYYALKTAMIARYRLAGRPTHSVLDTPSVLRAPAEPYRVGRPYHRRGSGMLELPIGVTRDVFGRLPYFGTSLTMAGAFGAVQLTRLVLGRQLVNIELHGIDAADADADGLGALTPHQPDLRRPAQAKLAALRAALLTLRDAGYRFVTLRDAARAFA